MQELGPTGPGTLLAPSAGNVSACRFPGVFL